MTTPHIYRLATTALRQSRPCSYLLLPTAPRLYPIRRTFTSISSRHQNSNDLAETSIITAARNDDNALSPEEAAAAAQTEVKTDVFGAVVPERPKILSIDDLIDEENDNTYYPDQPKYDEEGDDQHDPDIPEWEADDVTPMAHGEIEQHREYRQYARLAMWEMPKLTSFATPFEPPTEAHLLKFRYTSYMGVEHPGAKKVAMEVDITKLKDMNNVQIRKLKKLCGARYDPVKKIFKFSCDSFETQAQNKKYLSDTLDSLIVEAKDATDTFADIPIDLRHYKRVRQPVFPDKWKLPTQALLERRQRQWGQAPKEEKANLREVMRKYMPKEFIRPSYANKKSKGKGPDWQTVREGGFKAEKEAKKQAKAVVEEQKAAKANEKKAKKEKVLETVNT